MSTNDTLFQQLQSVYEEVQPTAIQNVLFVDVDISLLDGEGLATTYEELIRERDAARVLPGNFCEQMERFLYTTLAWRVWYNSRDKERYKYTPELEFIKIPAFWALALGMLGECHVIEQNITIRPRMEIDLKKVMGKEEAMKFFRYLCTLDKVLTLVDFPKTRTGDVAFMTKVLVNDTIRGMNSQDSPVYAALSVLITKVVDDNLSDTIFRVSYANAHYYRTKILGKDFRKALE